MWYGGEGNIFCGGFIPDDFEPRGTITEVGLSLVWRLGEATTPTTSTSTTNTTTTLETTSSTIATSTGNASSTPITTTSTTEISGPETTEPESKITEESQTEEPAPDPEPNPEPTPTSTPETSSSSTSLWNWLFPIVLAQEASSTPETSSSTTPAEEPSAPEPEASSTSTEEVVPPQMASSTEPVDETEAETGAPETTTSTASEPEENTEPPTTEEITEPTQTTTTEDTPDDKEVIELPPIVATIEDSSSTEDTTSTSTIKISTSTPIIPAPVPDENFLKVSVSTDGSNWEEVGLVNGTNWQNFTASLSITDWEELKNLQVKIETIDSTETTPPLTYLDGIFIEIKYTTLSFLELGDEVSSEDIILLPTSLLGGKQWTNTETLDKIAAFFNPKYSEIISPNSYDERRTIFFGWCGTMITFGERIKICDDISEPEIKSEEVDKLSIGLGKSISTIDYTKRDLGIIMEMNLINDGWWSGTEKQPVELIIEYPSRFSISEDGASLFLDKGHVEIKTPPGHTSISKKESSRPGFEKAIFSYDLDALPLNNSSKVILELWKR